MVLHKWSVAVLSWRYTWMQSLLHCIPVNDRIVHTLAEFINSFLDLGFGQKLHDVVMRILHLSRGSITALWYHLIYRLTYILRNKKWAMAVSIGMIAISSLRWKRIVLLVFHVIFHCNSYGPWFFITRRITILEKEMDADKTQMTAENSQWATKNCHLFFGLECILRLLMQRCNFFEVFSDYWISKLFL